MMNKSSLSILATFALAGVALCAKPTWVPKGTHVTLAFDQEVNSRNVHVGDKVSLHITDPVIVDGKTVLASGAHVTGLIASVRKQTHFGVNAKMQITMEPIHGITLVPRTAGKDSGSRPDHAAEVAGAGAIVLGPVGLVGGYFVVGKPVVIKEGDKIETEVSKRVRVD